MAEGYAVKRHKHIAAAALMLILCGCGASEPLPAVLFYYAVVYPNSLEGAPPDYRRLVMRDGSVYTYSGDSGLKLEEIAAHFEAGTLTDYFEKTDKQLDAEEAAAQFRKLRSAAKSNPELVYPDAVPAVEEASSGWYTYLPLGEGDWQYVDIGEEFCGTHYPSESEKINEVYEWLSAQWKG